MPPPDAGHRTFVFGDLTLDLDRGALIRDGADIKLRPQSYRVLRHMVERHGVLLTRDELVQAVWGDTVVTDGSLTHCVIDIRKAICDTSQQMIRTVPRRGYIFDLIVTSHHGAARNSETRIPLPASVAVLPFTCLSSDPEREYFCDGMSEEIINVLSRIEGLKVAARASTFRFKGRGQDISEVGRTLNVRTVLDGSVRTAGKRLRIAVQLVEVDSGYEIWTERYDREMDDIFAIQEEIAESIATILRAKLVIGMPSARDRHRTDSIEAYHLYLKGQHTWYKREECSLTQAAKYFEQAVELDPEYALAHVGTALAYTGLAVYAIDPRIARQKTNSALDRARAIDPDFPELWAAIGYQGTLLTWEWEAAERALLRAVETNPAAAKPYCWQVILLGALGRHDEAIAAGRKAVELDPLSSYANNCLGQALIGAEREQEAIKIVEDAREVDPDDLGTAYILGQAYAGAERYEDGVAVLEIAARRSNRNVFYLSWLGWVLGLAGRRAEADRILDEFEERRAEGYVAPIYDVNIYCGLDDSDRAFEWLEKVIEERTWFLPQIAAYRHLRSDPRFDGVLERMGLY